MSDQGKIETLDWAVRRLIPLARCDREVVGTFIQYDPNYVHSDNCRLCMIKKTLQDKGYYPKKPLGV